MTDKYSGFLRKKCTDKVLIDLLKALKESWLIERETYYVTNGNYPADRNLLDKLLVDLITAKTKLEEDKNARRTI